MTSPMSNLKIHPQDFSKVNGTQDEAEVKIPVPVKIKPHRNRSIEFAAEAPTVSQKYRNTITTSSFMSQGSSGANPMNASVEALINFLTPNIDNLTDRTFLKRFEELSYEVLANTRDPELHRIAKSHGWTGTRYKATEDTPLEAQSLLQAFSNWYLKNKISSYTAHISNLFGLGDSKGADQILSFCPNTLLSYLRTYPIVTGDESGVRSFAFHGACMLADISGFSKFSGAMCSKGVSGLDDLREATNGFLGHFVKTVYEHHGDVIAFAGDALICVFTDSKPATPNASRNASRHDLADLNMEDDDEGPLDGKPFNEVKEEDPTAPPSTGGGGSQKNGSQKSEPRSQRQNGSSKQEPEPMVSDSCFRAIKCACALRLHKTDKLSTHLGISFGEMKLALLGGLQDQWVYLMNGECVSELAPCITDAGPEEVAVTSACYESAMVSVRHQNEQAVKRKENMERAGHECKDFKIVDIVSHRIDAANSESNYLIQNIDETHSDGTKLTAFGRKMSVLVKKKSSRYIEDFHFHDQQSLIESAALFVPRPVLTAVYSESLDHIGELRQVTTMFLSLDSYSPELHKDPASLQPFFIMAQGLLLESGGFLRQFLVDDKGCVLIAMWGMPSFTYANNCSRALFCAVSLILESKKIGETTSAGITTGNVFCGYVGALERRDYAGIGNEVNMAARLMSKAHGRVLIDNNTYQNLNQASRDMLTATEPMLLKGSAELQTPYAYCNDEAPRIAAVDEQPGYSTILRRQVKAILGIQIDKITNSNPIASSGNLSDSKSVFFTIILGLPGTGKSTAAEYFRHGARKRNIPCVYIQARPGHEGVPYGLMRELFLELIGEDNFDTEDQQRSLVTSLIEQAYVDCDDDEKAKARMSLELLLGVDWSDVFSAKAHNGASSSLSNRNSMSMDEPGQLNGMRSPNGLKGSTDEHGERENFAGMFFDSSLTLCRKMGDMTFYKVITVLLKNIPTAIIIEDAHFIDELSWNELHLMLLGRDLNIAVLITMRSNTNAKANAFAGNSSSEHNPHSGSPSHNHNPGNGNTIRQSLIISRGADSTSTTPHSNSGSQHAMNPATPGGQQMQEGGDATSKYGLKIQTSASYLSIVGHENSTVIEMTGLNEQEVKDVLMHTLKVDTVSNDLVKLVLDVSSGNAFWCKSIASFIKERGIKELEETIKQGVSPQNSLKVLILMRMEKLSIDFQLVLKHASIIGDEFSEPMLAAVLPPRLKTTLSESLDLLAEHGFILCIEEYPELIFGFQNQLIRSTLYELMPPSDANMIHLHIGEFIESEYSKNLRPFYPILGIHYAHCLNMPIGKGNKKKEAFKYKVKAGDQAISRGAFNDGLAFIQDAEPFAQSRSEYRVLLDVISRAIGDIAPPPPTTKIGHGLRRLSKSFSTHGDHDMANRMSQYMTLKMTIESKLDGLNGGGGNTPSAGSGNDDLDRGGPKNRKLMSNRQPSARLTWQPSYVASKKNAFLSDDDEDDDDDADHGDKSKCCTVS